MTRARTLAVLALLASGCIPDTKKLDPFRSAGSVCPVLFDKITGQAGRVPRLRAVPDRPLLRQRGPHLRRDRAGEKAGRIGYDRSVTEACIKAIDVPGCDALGGGPVTAPSFVPRVAPGSLRRRPGVHRRLGRLLQPGPACPGQVPARGATGAPLHQHRSSCGANHFCDTSARPPPGRAAARPVWAALREHPLRTGAVLRGRPSAPSSSRRARSAPATTSAATRRSLLLRHDAHAHHLPAQADQPLPGRWSLRLALPLRVGALVRLRHHAGLLQGQGPGPSRLHHRQRLRHARFVLPPRLR